MESYQIYTDGACFPNPNGCGGWAFVVVKDREIVYQDKGCEKNTTNNRMELTAILKALEWIGDNCHVNILSDSQYAINCIAVWYKGWLQRGVLDKRSNTDLIGEAYDIYKARHKQIDINWVRGHNGNMYNEIADELSNKEMTDLYKEVNGVEISISEVNEHFAELKAKNRQQRPTKEQKWKSKYRCYPESRKEFARKVKESETVKETKLRIIKDEGNYKTKETKPNKVFTITTEQDHDKFIVINGTRYKRYKRT